MTPMSISPCGANPLPEQLFSARPQKVGKYWSPLPGIAGKKGLTYYICPRDYSPDRPIRKSPKGETTMARRADPPQHVRFKRQRDPYLDRRSGEDRRKVYSLDYFYKGNVDRRRGRERRSNNERRRDCIRINQWSSVCPDQDELTEGKPHIINLSGTKNLG